MEVNRLGYEYEKEDFLTAGPYEELYKLARDPFRHARELEELAAYAAQAGFKGFKGMYRAYVATMKAQRDTVYIDNVTAFEGQPMELNAGDWEAGEGGVCRKSGCGYETACPHPVMPVERLVNIDTGEEKVRVAYRKGPQWRNAIVDKAVLASSNKVTDLARLGIAVTSQNARAFVEYMNDLENLNYDAIPERLSIGRFGYIPGEGFSPFVDGLIFDGDANFRTMFRAVRQSGRYGAWKEIAAECRSMSTTVKIILASSFASVLLEPLGALPFFVHLWGVDSGTGKTVALMLAASVWADPTIGAYVKTFDATVVGHEKTAAFLNHLPLCLDELQLARDGKGRLQFDVYKLAQGVGRTRGNRGGGVDMTPTWRNCILTTGESPLTGTGAGAGAVNRVIDIECRAADAVITDGMRISNALKRNFGFAGREFVGRLYEPGALDGIQRDYQELFRALSSSDTTEKQAMAAAAIIEADRLACDWIFDGEQDPLTVREVSAFLASKAAVSAGDRAYRYLCDWVARNGNRLCGRSDTQEVYGALEDGRAYIIRSVFDDVIGEAGFSAAATLSYLKSAGLIDTRGRNYTRGKRMNGRLTECVSLKLEDIDDDVDAERAELPL